MDATDVKDAVSVRLALKAEGCTLCVDQSFFSSEPLTTFLPGRTLVFILATSR